MSLMSPVSETNRKFFFSITLSVGLHFEQTRDSTQISRL
jgi:hypothetical protein